MQIRKAALDDLPSINTICDTSNREHWSREMIAPISGRLVLVAAKHGKIVGVAKTHFHDKADGKAPAGHYLGGILVSPEHRRQGIGSALTRARMEWIWPQSTTVYYFANEHNTASITMHEALGFQFLGRFGQIRGVTADQGRAELILFSNVSGAVRSHGAAVRNAGARDGK